MKLFHGTVHTFDIPDPEKGRDETDFGKGFYVTDVRKMAEDWHVDDPHQHVYSYELTLEKIDSCELHIRRFEKADDKWAKFVYNNRRAKSKDNQSDIIIGPVADNDLNIWFDRVERNELSWEEMAVKIDYKKYKSLQFCFKSQQSIKLLENA